MMISKVNPTKSEKVGEEQINGILLEYGAEGYVWI
jgi:hypothetical protein